MPTPPKKSWTFMVYLAGDNNLDPNGVKDLKEMKKVGSTDRLNLIAQFDREAGHKTQRYFLRKGGQVTADSVASLGATNTGDPKVLTDFIQWGVQNYPADHYALVLWNHGQGWDDTDIYAGERHRRLRRLASSRVRHALFHTPVRRTLTRAITSESTRAILLDDNAKDFLDNLEMKKVLATTQKLIGHKLDLLGMDACLMSMAEVGYQVRSSVELTVGSEQTEPVDGWPYDTLLAELARKPGMTGRALSKVIVTQYVASYRRDPVTQSTCDLTKAAALAQAVRGLAGALKPKLRDAKVRQGLLTARTKAQSYEVRDNIDLVDFCSLLSKALAGTEIARRCQDVIRVVKLGYVISQAYQGTSLKNSHGVAIYFPTQSVSPLYTSLDFSKRTGWGTFLKAYLAAVRNR